MVLALERESGVGAEGGTSPSCFQPALHRMGTGWTRDGHRNSSSWNPPEMGGDPLPAGQHQLHFRVIQCLRWVIPAVPRSTGCAQSTGDTKISLVQMASEIKT